MDAFLLVVVLLVVVGLAIYFIPTFVANKRESKDVLSVFVINLFLGWTLVGWVVALAWALKGQHKKEPDKTE